ncbi:hypothetical protein ABIE00_000790 [Arthrobacter sp. OAP107]
MPPVRTGEKGFALPEIVLRAIHIATHPQRKQAYLLIFDRGKSHQECTEAFTT